MLIAILTGFLFAILLFFGGKKLVNHKFALLPTLIPLGLFIYFVRFIGEVSNKEFIHKTYEWIPSLGVNLSFTLDGLSLLFTLLITGIGTLVFAYTSGYLKGHEYLDRFYGYLSIFMGAMLGLVLSDNLISFLSSGPPTKNEKLAPKACAVRITAPAFIAFETFSTPIPKYPFTLSSQLKKSIN